jgi:hypothetical protein
MARRIQSPCGAGSIRCATLVTLVARELRLAVVVVLISGLPVPPERQDNEDSDQRKADHGFFRFGRGCLDLSSAVANGASVITSSSRSSTNSRRHTGHRYSACGRGHGSGVLWRIGVLQAGHFHDMPVRLMERLQRGFRGFNFAVDLRGECSLLDGVIAHLSELVGQLLNPVQTCCQFGVVNRVRHVAILWMPLVAVTSNKC